MSWSPDHVMILQFSRHKMLDIKKLKKMYKDKKGEIENRLHDFKKIWERNDRKIFAELCFCILTPQSKAESCDGIIRKLEDSQLLFRGNINQIRPYLKNARFYKNKSRYLIAARRLFLNNGRIAIKNKIDIKNINRTREWLVNNVKGIGYKEASHFLRNIGFGNELAILDIHILRNLRNLGVVEDMPRTLTKRTYLTIEDRLKHFSDNVKIPMSHLDLLLWSSATKKIFK